MKKLLMAFIFITFLSSCEQKNEQIHLHGATMGTTYNIKYLPIDDLDNSKNLQAKIDILLEEVNDQMSTYRPNSELSRFNTQQTNDWFEVSPQIITVINEAIRLNKLTQGALDITIGNLVNLWGFGPDAKPDQVPSDKELLQARENSGIKYLTVEGNKLKKEIPKLYVDLSTIGKGWGVDLVAEFLIAQGITNYMVEIGGEIRLNGKNQHGKPWTIAVEKPSINSQNSVQEIISIENTAIATSGDYRNYFEENGVRYSHIINPQTGRPIDHKVVSVTVLDRSSMSADGLATGLMVLGDKIGMQIAQENNIPALMIVKTDNGFIELKSKAYKKLLETAHN